MANPILVTIENPDEQLAMYGAGALYRVERSPAGGGVGFAEVGTGAIVTLQVAYPFIDDTGVAGDWYRVRYSTAVPALPGDYSVYSAEFQGGIETGVVSLASVKYRLGITDSEDDPLLVDFIAAVGRTLDSITGRRFVGDIDDEVYYFDGKDARKGGMVLPVPIGLQSVTKLELAGYTGGAYELIDPADYFLDPAQPDPGWPFTSIEFSDFPTGASAYYHVYPGKRTVKLTGKAGFAAVLGDVAEIAHHIVARYHRGKKSGDNNLVGTTTFGTTVVLRHMSPEERAYLDEVYRNWSYN
ncbi:MAG: phage gp6-like head-tail connector protein [Acidobacteria bacterium]|nr:phage gp6-like head-tail connector protein [Acidobacteriota bacterium]